MFIERFSMLLGHLSSRWTQYYLGSLAGIFFLDRVDDVRSNLKGPCKASVGTFRAALDFGMC